MNKFSKILVAAAVALGLASEANATQIVDSLSFAAGGANLSAAPAGTVGEIAPFSVPLGSAVTLTTTATPYNLSTVSLSPGQWECFANVILTAAGTTFPSAIVAWNTTSATLPTAPAGGYAQNAVSATTGVGGINSGAAEFQVSVLTPVYAVVQGAFTGSAPTAYGAGQCKRLR